MRAPNFIETHTHMRFNSGILLYLPTTCRLRRCANPTREISRKSASKKIERNDRLITVLSRANVILH